MAKIKLTKVLKEGIEQREKNRSEIKAHLDLFAKRLEDLKIKMRRDGHSV